MNPPAPRSVRLPRGVRDYLPEAAERRAAIATALLDEFERWGYRRIVTPAFEYEDVLARGLGEGAQAQAVRFVEPGSGEVVMLRPDITPQVARLVATRLGDAGEAGVDDAPLRLAYEGAVVRLAPSVGGQRELFQAGVELIGAGSPDGDVEVLALAAASLDSAGVARYTLDLAEASVARAALAGLPADVTAALKEAIARKDEGEVARIAAGLGLPARRARLLEALPGLYGGPEVIDRAASLVDKGEAAARAGLQTLRDVIVGLGRYGLSERLSIDLGEVRGFDYYTGVRFQGYAPGVGDALLSGGRYDSLLARYGRPARAAGFAVDVERVGAALLGEPDGARSVTGIWLAGPSGRRHPLAQALRAVGVRVAEDLSGDDAPPASLRARARRSGLARAVLLGKGGARWFDVDGSDGRIAAADLASLVERGEPLAAILPSRYLGDGPGLPVPAITGPTRRADRRA